MGRAIATMPLGSLRLPGRQDEVKVLQHAGSRAPDVALAIGHRVIAPLAALVLPAVDLVIDLVEEVLERDFEDVGDFARIRTNGEPGRHDADDRRYLEAGAGAVEVDRPDDIDEARGD